MRSTAKSGMRKTNKKILNAEEGGTQTIVQGVLKSAEHTHIKMLLQLKNTIRSLVKALTVGTGSLNTDIQKEGGPVTYSVLRILLYCLYFRAHIAAVSLMVGLTELTMRLAILSQTRLHAVRFVTT